MTVNNGGRVSFSANTQVRILTKDCKVSQDTFIVESDKSDRKGQVCLRTTDTLEQIKIQYRRILPVEAGGSAVVVESNGKYRAVCPDCNYIESLTGNSEFLNCRTHGQFPLYWLGVKPVEEQVANVGGDSNGEIHDTVVNPEKSPRVTKSPIVVDFVAFANTPDCELWTKKGVKFDHERVSVQSHTLLFVGINPRKLCFNTYNNTLGKVSEPLPFSQFIGDTCVEGAKNTKPWYSVKDIEKTRAKLRKDGYELHERNG